MRTTTIQKKQAIINPFSVLVARGRVLRRSRLHGLSSTSQGFACMLVSSFNIFLRQGIITPKGLSSKISHLTQLSCVAYVILKSLLCWVERYISQLKCLPSDLKLLLRLSVQHYPSCYPSHIFPTRTRHSSSLEESPPLSLCRLFFTGQGCPASFPSAPSLAHSPLWFPALEHCTSKVFSCGTVTALAWRSPLSVANLQSMLKKLSPALFTFSPH